MLLSPHAICIRAIESKATLLYSFRAYGGRVIPPDLSSQMGSQP